MDPASLQAAIAKLLADEPFEASGGAFSSLDELTDEERAAFRRNQMRGAVRDWGDAAMNIGRSFPENRSLADYLKWQFGMERMIDQHSRDQREQERDETAALADLVSRQLRPMR